MSDAAIAAIIGLASFILSVCAAVYISGARWGSITTRLDYIERDIRAIMAYFQLTPSDQPDRKRRH